MITPSVKKLLFFTSVFLLSACTQHAVVPKSAELVIEAGANINRYANNAHSVVVRLYQLSGPGPFTNAAFLDLLNNSAEALSATVVDVQTLDPVFPSEKRITSFDLQPNVNYIGVFAEFADYEQQKYLGVTLVNKSTEKRLGFALMKPRPKKPKIHVGITSSGIFIADQTQKSARR